MDIDLLKTFLEVYNTRHFAKAAENLFVTPSAVSARIRQLEVVVGVPLFVRDRKNMQLTRSGEQLLSYARSMLKLWERARYELASDADPTPNLAILAVPSLWDTLLQGWLGRLYLEIPDLGLRVESTTSNEIISLLQQNKANLGFLLEPREGPELELINVGQLQLIMVSSQPDQSPEQAMAGRYAMVDWSTSFHAQHSNVFPEALPSKVWVSTGHIAHELLLSAGGAAYLPDTMVSESLDEKLLFTVEDAPSIELNIYAAYPSWQKSNTLITRVLQMARERIQLKSSIQRRPA